LIYLFGAALGRNNRRKAAVKYLERAVYLDPKNPDYLYNLGVGYSSITQYANAAACFDEVSNIVSNNGAVWYNLGLARLFLAQTNKAVKAFEKVEIDSPVAPRALYYLALAAYNNHDDKTALSKLKMSLALSPDSIDAQYMKAVILGGQGKYNQAVKLLEKIYLIKQENEIENELVLLYVKWGEKALEKKEYKTALDRFRQAGSYLPKDPELQINITKTALKAGQYKLAKQAFARAQQLAETARQEETVSELREEISKLK
jgi:tetratricopeptide (TPR) repeat protein